MPPLSDQSPNPLSLKRHESVVGVSEGRQKRTFPALPKAEVRMDYVFEMYKRGHSLILVTHEVTGTRWYIYGTCACAHAPPETPEQSATLASSRGHYRGLVAAE